MNVIYDITVLGLHHSKEDYKTGVFRVVEFLFQHLNEIDEINLEYSHTSFHFYNDFSRIYLTENGKAGNLIIQSTRDYTHLPNNLFGKAHRYFNFFFRQFGIDINKSKVIFDKDSIVKFQIFHSPFYPIPTQLKNVNSLRRVITIYDLIPILFPNLHTLKKEIEETINSIGDDFAICISDCTRKDLLKYNPKLDPNKVFVTMLAASPKIFYKCVDKNKFESIQKKYNIPEKYFLSLSTLEPRKNIDHVIRAFVKFVNDFQIQDLSLVLVGVKGWMFEKILEECENAVHLQNRIIITGRIPDEDLASIYSNAHSFYYMSVYEGFGLPPLEAMQCGVATVTSNTSSLPEVVEEGGIMLDPFDTEGLVNVMSELYLNNELREKYRDLGLMQSKKFSWDACAKKHVEIYNQILNWE